MKLVNGDCLVELQKFEAKSVDFFFLDLPYGQTACKWDKKIDLDKLWVQLKRLAKNERTPFFFSTTTKFGFELYKHAPKGWFRWDLVWKKNLKSGFLNAYRLPMRQHEMIYCFAKKTPDYDTSSHKEFSKTELINIGERDDNHYGLTSNDIGKTHKERLPTSDISSWCEYNNDNKTGHRTAKPVNLMKFLLKYWTKEGDVVCDPTAGSGSMGIACKLMKRKFIGIEKDEQIFELMKKRTGS